VARLGRSFPVQPLFRPYNYSIDGQYVWFAVYVTTTGELYSVGSVVADPLPGIYTALELERQPDLAVVMWDTTTRTFVPRPPDPPVDRVADLLADGTLTSAWASLSGPDSTAMQTRIGTMLGPYRYRSSIEPIDL
jgi:hypothetical protein